MSDGDGWGADGQVSFGVGDWAAFAIALATPSLLSYAAFKPQPNLLVASQEYAPLQFDHHNAENIEISSLLTPNNAPVAMRLEFTL